MKRLHAALGFALMAGVLPVTMTAAFACEPPDPGDCNPYEPGGMTYGVCVANEYFDSAVSCRIECIERYGPDSGMCGTPSPSQQCEKVTPNQWGQYTAPACRRLSIVWP